MRRLCAFLLFAAATALSIPGATVAGEEEEPPAAAPLSPAELAKRIAEEKARLTEEHKAFVASVNAAITKGRAWLEAQQASDGSFKGYSRPGYEINVQDVGVNALCLLTLVKCGADERDESIRKGLTYLKSFYKVRKNTGGLKTYSAALVVMFWEALYRKESKAERAGDPAAKPETVDLPAWAQVEVRSIADWLASFKQEGYWPYPGSPGKTNHEDLSNTQYALLGLQTASRCGIEVPAAVYTAVLERLLSKQEASGPDVARSIENPAYDPGGDDRYGKFLKGRVDHARGWGYGTSAGGKATGSMTVAGLSTLCIVKDRLRALNALPKAMASRIDTALLDGMAWMDHHFAVEKNPENGVSWLHYYLYGLERAGAYLGAKHFGPHDWYAEGAKFLVGNQSADGGWPGDKEAPGRALNSCFALLFLKRATIPPSRPVGPTTTGD